MVIVRHDYYYYYYYQNDDPDVGFEVLCYVPDHNDMEHQVPDGEGYWKLSKIGFRLTLYVEFLFINETDINYVSNIYFYPYTESMWE